MIGYRRHGHSEVDDPTITQPLLYKAIKEPSAAVGDLRRRYRHCGRAGPRAGGPRGVRSRAEEGRTHPQEAHAARLAQLLGRLQRRPSQSRSMKSKPACPAGGIGRHYGAADHLSGGLSHPSQDQEVARTARRDGQRASAPVDYGMAEALAFGSLVKAGVPVRLSGQDSRRGTFNQRHSVLLDIENEQEYVPLQHIAAGPGALRNLQLHAVRSRRVWDSNTATAATIPRLWCCGRRSSATSPTWRRR